MGLVRMALPSSSMSLNSAKSDKSIGYMEPRSTLTYLAGESVGVLKGNGVMPKLIAQVQALTQFQVLSALTLTFLHLSMSSIPL